MSCGNAVDSSDRASFGRDLFSSSQRPSLSWINEQPPGNPEQLLGPDSHGAEKGIYRSLDATSGALTEHEDPVQDVESLELERLMGRSIGSTIEGWDSRFWNNYKITGKERTSRVLGIPFTPVHLRYAFSKDSSVYTIKKAMVQDVSEYVRYPWSLSNLISITIRGHELDASIAPLRHVLFYNVENEAAWSAMKGAFLAMGINMPIFAQNPQAETSRHNKGRPKKRDTPQASPSVCVTIESSNPEHKNAWDKLHTDNPFTKVMGQLAKIQGDLPSLPEVISYTLIAVAQESFFPGHYWSALIAHLGPPAELEAGKSWAK